VGAVDAAASGHRRENEKSLLYILLVIFCGWYSFGEIINTDATRCHILMLKCTKFDVASRIVSYRIRGEGKVLSGAEGKGEKWT